MPDDNAMVAADLDRCSVIRTLHDDAVLAAYRNVSSVPWRAVVRTGTP
jgi:hypothetical protein